MEDSKTIVLYMNNQDERDTALEIEQTDEEGDVHCILWFSGKIKAEFWCSPQSARRVAIGLLEAAN